jgi:hypothetical protein
MKIDWKFQPNEDGTSQGWNDSTIAQFKSNRLESLTRETIQNSLDARLDKTKPVVVAFKEQAKNRDEIPNVSTLQEILHLCDADKATQNPDMIKELSEAIKLLKAPKVRVLSIEDYNTTGMPGPCEPGMFFYNYVKAVGQSSGSATRAGSHGLGKGAPLACSALRSIVVSTKWATDTTEHGLIQGRAVLMSHKKNGKIYKGTGYWGNTNGYQAIDPKDTPTEYSWLKRTEVGTTIHLLGWESPNRWKDLVKGYAIANYFAAFARNSLILRIDDEEVSVSNFEKLANSEDIRAAMKREKSEDNLNDALAYLKCLDESEQVKQETSQMNHLGRTSFRFRLYESAPRKVAMIRNNMLITDSIPGFWKRVPTRLSDFVGLVEVLDESGSQLIRSMEPPLHNELSKDWLATAEDRRKGGAALDKLAEEIKKFIERHAGGGDDVIGRVDFMADFFADEAGDDRGQRLGEEFNPNGRFTFTPKQVKLLPITQIKFEDDSDFSEVDGENIVLQDDEGSSVTDPDNGGENGGGRGINSGDDPKNNDDNKDGPGSGDGDGGVGGEDGTSTRNNPNKPPKRDKPERELSLDNVRIVKVGSDSVRVYLTSTANISAYLRIHEIGADISLPFEITVADTGTVEDGTLNVKLKRGERTCICMSLSRPIIGGLKLIASA